MNPILSDDDESGSQLETTRSYIKSNGRRSARQVSDRTCELDQNEYQEEIAEKEADKDDEANRSPQSEYHFQTIFMKRKLEEESDSTAASCKRIEAKQRKRSKDIKEMNIIEGNQMLARRPNKTRPNAKSTTSAAVENSIKNLDKTAERAEEVVEDEVGVVVKEEKEEEEVETSCEAEESDQDATDTFWKSSKLIMDNRYRRG